MTPHQLPSFRRKLLAWFDANARPLAWRKDRDPYRIWVSEVMLQQTTVAAVGPYFVRFLAAFPTVQALAAADEQQVLKLWEGLGYYRRARHLHAAARRLVEGGGGLPDDPAVWADLPGVGRYILGAVLSQAFDRRMPIVEANTLRVLCRLFGFAGDPRTGDGKKWLWERAEAVLPDTRVGDFNQAMMELGSLACTPTAPACGRCPAAGVCVANRDGTQTVIPPKATRPTVLEVQEVAVVIRDGDRVLLCRRPADAGRWQNMWEFPHAEVRDGEDTAVAATRVAGELTGLEVRVGPTITTVRHGVTRFAISMECVEATRTGGRFRSEFYAEGEWVLPAALGEYPVSTPQRTLIRELTKPGRQLRLL